MNKPEKTSDFSMDLEIASVQNRLDDICAKIANVKSIIANEIFGQEKVIDLCLCAIFGGSHSLLVGMPGVAKTSLIAAIAKALGQDFKRIQFTPDLMPSDILGSEILETASDQSRNFRFVKGPIFTQILMADEINRASPKTQSALLEAMQENRVTIAGHSYQLPLPFHVLASQNPIEHEGAYPLPEAQLDRFLLQIDVPYPDEETEKKILLHTTQQNKKIETTPLAPSDLLEIQDFVRQFPISERFLDIVMALVRNLRPQTTKFENVQKYIEWGPGPRAGQALIMASKARALLRGRPAPSLDDLNFVAHSALIHRISFNWAAKSANVTLNDLINQIFEDAGA
jgi:MoxR-like ATPase